MEIEKLGFRDVSMMDGERVQSSLNLNQGHTEESDADANVVFLTDKRVIHLSTNGPSREAVFMSLRDISTVEVTAERRGGYAGYVWGGLAVVVALLLWFVWDNPPWSYLASMVVVAMGVYLVFDHLQSTNMMTATFRTGSNQLRLTFKNADQSGEVYSFINHVFQLKDEVVGRDTGQIFRFTHH